MDSGGPDRGSKGSIAATLWPWGCAALSGVLLALCFPRYNQGWLAWLALAPLISAVWFSERRARRNWIKDASLGYCAGLVFFWWTFEWLTTVTGLGWFLLAFYLGLYFAFWGWFIGAAARFFEGSGSEGAPAFLGSGRNIALGLACAAAWTGQEFVRGILFGGFGWNGLGVALHGNIAMIQIAEWTGLAGLSFLVCFCNSIAVITVRRFIAEAGRGRIRPHYDFSLMMLLVVLTFVFGVRALRWEPAFRTVRIAAIQGNIRQDEKFDEAFEDEIFSEYQKLTLLALASHPQLVIWPEAATPRGMYSDEKNYEFVMDIAREGPFDFLLGTQTFDGTGDHNSAVLLTGSGTDIQMYSKMHLVPFGEYIPLRKAFPPFVWIAGDEVPSDFEPGREFSVFHTDHPSLSLAPLICFEDTIGDLTRRFVLNGAELLLDITNDGWFQHSPAAEQHLANAVFRTVEERRPLIRCANTGVTCVVDEFGRVAGSLWTREQGYFTQGFLAYDVHVPMDAPLTFYARHGEWLAWGCCGATVFFTLIWMAGSKRR